jgi:hypothetical protein
LCFWSLRHTVQLLEPNRQSKSGTKYPIHSTENLQFTTIWMELRDGPITYNTPDLTT